MAGIGDVANSGSMPISANGGAAGDSKTSSNSSFKVGALNMGSKSGNALLIAAVIGLVLYFLLKK